MVEGNVTCRWRMNQCHLHSSVEKGAAIFPVAFEIFFLTSSTLGLSVEVMFLDFAGTDVL